MKVRIFVLVLSFFIHACIFAVLPGWKSPAFPELPDTKKIIRVTLLAPKIPDIPQPTRDASANVEEMLTPTAVFTKQPPVAAAGAESLRAVPELPKTPVRTTATSAPVPEETGKDAPRPVPVPRRRVRPKPEKQRSPSTISPSRPASVPKAAPIPYNADSDKRQGEDTSTMRTEESGISVATLTGDGILSVADVSVTRKISPVYPLASRSNGEQGTVVLIADIGGGRVVSVEIETSSGYKRLDTAAIHAVRHWGFASEERIRIRIPVSFRLSASD